MIDFNKLYNDLYNAGYHNELGFTHSKKLITYINNLLKINSKILDVGCSNGTACLLLKDKYVCSGIDISEKAIEIAKENGVIDCKPCPTHNIDYKNNLFDAILCTDVLEHVDEKNIEKTFKEFNRVTKNNAYYFLKIAVCQEKNRKYNSIKEKHKIQFLHVFIKNSEYWFELFKKYNLKTIKILDNNKNFIQIVLKKTIIKSWI